MTRHRKSIRRGQGSLSLYAAIGLLLLFGALTTYVLLARERERMQADAARLSQLEGASLPDTGLKGDDWPQWRGPKRDGVASDKQFLAPWPTGGPKKLWQQPTGLGYSSLAVARGRVFTIFQDGPDETVCCWNVADGKEVWRFRYPARYVNNFGNGPRSTPTIDGDLIYTVGATGIMHCLKAFTDTPAGEKVWRKDLLDEFGATNLQWGVSFSPLIVGGLIYTNPGGPDGKSLAALDKKTGATVWTSQDDDAGYSSPIAAEFAGDPQILFFTAEGLVAVTPDKGTLRWRYPWKTSHGANIATPIMVQDYVFISSGYHRGCTVVKVDKSDNGFNAARVYENKKMRTHFSTCVRHGDYLYGFDDTNLTCLDFRTGKQRWREGDLGKGSLLLVDDRLLILGEHGAVALAEAAPEEYREISRFTFSEKKCWTVPVVAEGRLFIRDEEKLVCYDVRK